ncbi:hypothetical protein BU25DRAFT_36994 [Macroventuria anomochaeta]|uniref:Uncharacterized protein n=1 Tax=Macroventuria anomochaeta TaxID=301207 RepID=A0ACB6S554_9PLEO|nr:uncharacterized protein BU25DRAFT_36994 [Macroventuria anomochaeta]KAF2628493.1 hypothetical protein BU25DRAFT_36994 [Macroventuria anomochaeta]
MPTKSKLGDVVRPCRLQGTIDLPDMPPYPRKGCAACNYRCLQCNESREFLRCLREAGGRIAPAPEAVDESDHSPRISTSGYGHVHVTCWRCDISSFRNRPATNRLLATVSSLTRRQARRVVKLVKPLVEHVLSLFYPGASAHSDLALRVDAQGVAFVNDRVNLKIASRTPLTTRDTGLTIGQNQYRTLLSEYTTCRLACLTLMKDLWWEVRRYKFTITLGKRNDTATPTC